MATKITIDTCDAGQWDAFVEKHPHASVYHRYGFRQTIEKAYRRKAFYLTALDTASNLVSGVLPLFLMANPILGKSLVSLPYCDYGGMLYDEPETGSALFEYAREMAVSMKADYLELRQTFQLPFLPSSPEGQDEHNRVITSKIRMQLALPKTSADLFASFPAKLRSQVRKPQKDGCTVLMGGGELLDDFYGVFVYNMRDLGSPVHSKTMMANTLKFYAPRSKMFVVYLGNKPIACSLVMGSGNTLVNPWASFNKNYRASAPNMLLYWSMLEFAVKEGYAYFDFGRSTKDEGTYRFKQQWGAQPQQLMWYYFYPKKQRGDRHDAGAKKALFIKVWRNLPLVVTRLAGPIIRKRIPL
jgi:serine/alanine adding enzyme